MAVADTRRPQALSNTPTLLLVMPLPSPLTTLPRHNHILHLWNKQETTVVQLVWKCLAIVKLTR